MWKTIGGGVLVAVLLAAGCGSSDSDTSGGGGQGGIANGGHAGGGHGGGGTGGSVAGTGGSVAGTGGGAAGSGGGAAGAGGGAAGTGGGTAGSSGQGGGGHAGVGSGVGGHGGGGTGGGAAGVGGGGHGGGGTGGGAAGSGGNGGGIGGVGGNACSPTGGAGGAAWLTPPTVPAAIQVPSGATVKIHDRGIGAQVYTCTASGDGADGGADAGATTYAWVLKAPDAKLYDAGCVQVGTHGVGPNWTSTDGSIVVGVKVAQADSPMTDAIPWLLLRAGSHSGNGVFTDVTFVQRLNTTKGKAPASGCAAASVGVETRVDYTADYYFYIGGANADAGSGG